MEANHALGVNPNATRLHRLAILHTPRIPLLDGLPLHRRSHSMPTCCQDDPVVLRCYVHFFGEDFWCVCQTHHLRVVCCCFDCPFFADSRADSTRASSCPIFSSSADTNASDSFFPLGESRTNLFRADLLFGGSLTHQFSPQWDFSQTLHHPCLSPSKCH